MRFALASTSSRLRRTRHANGFTLIEVLVAMVILSVIAVMAWQGVDAMVRSRDVAQGHLASTLRIQTVIAQFEADIREVVDTQTLPSALQFDGASLRLTRNAGGGVQLVVWSLRNGNWQRWAGPVVRNTADLREVWMRSLQLMGNENAQVRALEGVSDWQLHYYRMNAWTNAQSTGDVANAFMTGAAKATGASAPDVRSAHDPLPTGVRLILTMAPGSGLAGTVTREILVAPQALAGPGT